MLAGVGNFFSNVRTFYNEINPATLTGAIDVVVVEQPDGTYQSSPFHVRFGKLGVIRSEKKVVYIEINGEPIDLLMKLGPHGEAFFVQGIQQEQWEGPDYLATSPIVPSPLAQAARNSKSDFALNKKKHKSQRERMRRETEQSYSSSSSDLSARGKNEHTMGFTPIDQEEDEVLESSGMFDIEVDDDNGIPIPDIQNGLSKTLSLPLIHESTISRTEKWAIDSIPKPNPLHPFSDTDITPLVSPVGSRPHTPKSDTECEYTDRKRRESEHFEQWDWGELPASSKQLAGSSVSDKDDQTASSQQHPQSDAKSSGLWSFMRNTRKMRHKPAEDGIYLDDIDLQQMEPEVAALYFTAPKIPRHDEPDSALDQIPSAHTMETADDDDVESGNGRSLPHSPDAVSMEARALATPTSESGTMKDHECGIYGDVAMSLCGNLIDNYTNVSAEIFEQHLVDYQTLSQKPTDMFLNSNLVVRISGKYYNWVTAAPMIMSMVIFHQTLAADTQDKLVGDMLTNKKQKGSSRGYWWLFGRGNKGTAADVESGSAHSTPNGSPKKSAAIPSSQTPTDQHSESGDDADDEKEKVVFGPLSVEVEPEPLPSQKTYVKTLRLTSEELGRLNLHEGQNEIEFSVTTSFQGTTRCQANIFLWKHTDKIIISDIDGTITRSDVWGQILPMVGKDWSQTGVTELYTRIARNGYRFAYLSARAIGQAQMTRDYLKSVKQGDLMLPEGPLFLNPSSLINAFHKEVIERKPEEFKIRCMSDIKSLFSSNIALYAGFGNRINDIFAYRAVGIPKSKIFLIDPKGRVKADFCETFQTSYSHLSDDTDHYFPPLEEVGGESAFHAPAEYSTFTYWREPIQDISLTLPE